MTSYGNQPASFYFRRAGTGFALPSLAYYGPSSRLASYLADRLIVFLADVRVYEAEIQESPTGGESVISGE